MRLVSADITFNFTLKTCHDSPLSSPAPTMGADKHIKNSPILPKNKDFLQLSIGEQSTENLCTGKKVHENFTIITI
jgi:hypothetical protein